MQVISACLCVMQLSPVWSCFPYEDGNWGNSRVLEGRMQNLIPFLSGPIICFLASVFLPLWLRKNSFLFVFNTLRLVLESSKQSQLDFSSRRSRVA